MGNQKKKLSPGFLGWSAFVLRSLVGCTFLYLLFALIYLSWWRDWEVTGIVLFIVLAVFTFLNNAR